MIEENEFKNTKLTLAISIIITVIAIGLIINGVNIGQPSSFHREGDYWYNAPDGTYWAYSSEIYANTTEKIAYFTPPESAPTQLHCGPFGWNATENFNHPRADEAGGNQLIYMVLVNNTIVSIYR